MRTEGFIFDRAGYAAARHLSGVREIRVVQQSENGYGAIITCDAEYARP